MPVLCENISVIIRASSVKQYFKGGEEAFHKTIPNKTGCCDGELYRVGFMNPFEVKNYIEILKKNGLQFEKHKGLTFKRFMNRSRNDVVVVDQHQGPTKECDWIEFGQFPVGDHDTMTSVCWLFEGTRFGLGPQISEVQLSNLAVPDSWTPQLTESISFQDGYSDSRFEFLQHENGLDVYRDKVTGKKHFTTENF